MKYIRLRTIAAAFAVATIGCGAETPAAKTGLDAETESAVAAAGAAENSAGAIKADLAYLADDAREGREAGSAGYLEAAHYVAARFKALGAKPGADGDWFQEVRLRSARRDLDAAQMALTAPDGASMALIHLEDYLIDRGFAAAEFDVAAPAVFAGYGVVDEASGYDDYADVDVRGKFVVAFSGAPASFDSERRAHFASGSGKRKAAAARGAVGFLTIPTEASDARSPWSRDIEDPTRSAMTWIGPDGAPRIIAPEIKASASMSVSGAAKLFAGAPETYVSLRAREAAGENLAGFDLAQTANLRGKTIFEEASSPNVVAFIEGADPILKDEVVVLTAHLDHIGVSEPKEPGGDAINNGALDNAMGVAVTLDVARAFAASEAPRRSIYFVAVTAEEKGLLGADYFARFPTIGSKRMVANVNLDMPMALYKFVDVIAFGAERSTLGPIVKKAAEAMNIGLMPDPIPEQGIFTRSDHYRFVEQGVPAVFLVYGFGAGGDEVFEHFIKTNYHRPTDDLSLPIDYESAATFATLNYEIARAVADADEAPRWVEGDFFGELFSKGAAGRN